MGYSYGDAVDKFLKFPELKAVGADKSIDIVKQIINKRVDFIIEIKPVVDAILKANPSWVGAIHEMDVELDAYDYYMAISKKSKYISWLDRINQVVEKMKNDGTMNRLTAGGKSD